MYKNINSSETSNKDLSYEIKKYIESFKFPYKKNKILVIYSKGIDLYSSIDVIEAISNECSFRIIKFDELDKSKSISIIKKSEALLSKRINSVKGDISERILLLSKILNSNNPEKISIDGFSSFSSDRINDITDLLYERLSNEKTLFLIIENSYTNTH